MPAYKSTQNNDEEFTFQMICNGYPDLLPKLIGEQNETDETGCEHWFCNNTYTRCDDFWTCENGADEVNCPPSTCPEFYHRCVFLNDTRQVSCLHISRAGDGIVDCIGATDEIKRCQEVNFPDFKHIFRCRGDTECISSYDLCDGNTECPLGDDELFCDGINKG